MIRATVLSFLMIFLSWGGWGQDIKTSTPRSAMTSHQKDPTYLICKLGGAVRTLRVEKQKGGPCITTYTKEGVDKVVGESWISDRCSRVLMNIRDNLEKARWKCKDISEARVSSSDKE